MLIVAGLMLVYPAALFDYIGIALVLATFALQKMRGGGARNFEEFAARSAGEGMAARLAKWQWIQQGLEAPGAADKIRLYDAYLRKMDAALAESDWLVGARFSMADVAMAP